MKACVLKSSYMLCTQVAGVVKRRESLTSRYPSIVNKEQEY